MNGLTQATLILADDHPLFLKGLTEVLKTEFLILGLAANGEELLDLLKATKSAGWRDCFLRT
jgi:DNA-binding NarL/FixJ family response regulator